jgi:hypothetical protein
MYQFVEHDISQMLHLKSIIGGKAAAVETQIWNIFEVDHRESTGLRAKIHDLYVNQPGMSLRPLPSVFTNKMHQVMGDHIADTF